MIRELAEKKLKINVKKYSKFIFTILLIFSLTFIFFLIINIFLILLKLQNFSFILSDIDVVKLTSLKDYYYDILLKANIETLQSFASIFTPVLALITLWQGYDKFLKDKYQQELIRKDKQFVDIINNLSSDNLSVKISAINSLPLFSNVREILCDKFTSKEKYCLWLRFNYPYLFETIETIINTLVLTTNIEAEKREIISRSCSRALSLINNNTKCHSILKLIWPETEYKTEYYNAIDLSNRSLRNIEITNLCLNGVEGFKIDFSHSFIEDSSFWECNFAGIKCINTHIRDTNFHNCNLNSANFDKAHFFNVNIYNISYEKEKVNLFNVSFKDTNFYKVNFGTIKFINCNFKNNNFSDCFFCNVEFCDCTFEDVNFKNAILDEETYNLYSKNIFKDYTFHEKSYNYAHFHEKEKCESKYGILQKDSFKS